MGLAIFLALATPLLAHNLQVFRVELQEQQSPDYTLTVNLPPASEFLSGEPTLPPRCQLRRSPVTLNSRIDYKLTDVVVIGVKRREICKECAKKPITGAQDSDAIAS